MRRRALTAASLVVASACGLGPTGALWPAGSPGPGVALAQTAAAPAPPELRRLFPSETEVLPGDAGLARLVLPAEVLAACRPDLSDLRLFDALEKEIPFLVDTGTPPDGAVEIGQRATPKIVEAGRSEIRRETGPPLRRETYTLALPDAAPQTGSWVLIVEPRTSGEFVARVRIDAVETTGRADQAAPAGAVTPLLQDASIFRLAGAQSVEKTRLPLPPHAGKRLRLTLETEHPFWLEPALRLESARTVERGGRIAVPLEVLSIRSEDERTLVDLARPAGIVPDLLRLETATPTFDRRVEVWDESRVRAGASLGSVRLFRVAALVPVGEQEIALRPARGERLRVEIDDGNSPALEKPVFHAVIRQPALIFSRPSGTATLRFGGGRAHRPRYDLAGLLPPPSQMVTGKRADAAALLYDPKTVRPARLGPVRPNPAYEAAPLLAFAMRPGAAIDRGVFSHVRSLTVPGAAEGLSRLRMQPADLAVLDDDLSDLRVADDAGRQWPYLVERDAAAELVPLEAAAPARKDGVSRYTLRIPVSPLLFDRLLLDTDATFFDRAFRLEAKTDVDDGRDSGERTLLRGRLARAADDPRAVSLDLPPTRVRALTLVVEDGDDAPLTLALVQARVVLPEIYLTAPAGRYTLLLGAADAAPPRYDLERVRDVVLAVQAAPIAAGPLEPNGAYSLSARLKEGGFRQTVLLWTVLVAAVVVLAFMTLRLARRQPAASA